MKSTPQRTCIACRAVRSKSELVRVVHTPDGRYLLDTKGKVSGRGAYVCPDPGCLAMAVRRKAFDRAFRQAVPAEAIAALNEGLQEYLRAQAGASEAPVTASGDSGEQCMKR